MSATYDPGSDVGRVRLLVSDVGAGTPPVWLFSNEEIAAFLSLGHSRVLLGAAIALETIASDQALVLKVITSQDLSTDGAKLSDALLKRAAVLRRQDDDDTSAAPDSSLDFAFAYPGPAGGPELANASLGWPSGWPW